MQTGTGPVFLPAAAEPEIDPAINNGAGAQGTVLNQGIVSPDGLPPFPALGKGDGIYYFEARADGASGAVKIVARWRAVELDRRGRIVKDATGKPKVFKPTAYCGRWSADARRGLPDDLELARQVVVATAEAYLLAQGIEPKKEEQRKGSNKRGQSKRKSK